MEPKLIYQANYVDRAYKIRLKLNTREVGRKEGKQKLSNQPLRIIYY